MATRTIRVDEEVREALARRRGRTWNERVRDLVGLPNPRLPFVVRVEPTEQRAYTATPEEAVYEARRMLDDARRAGHRVPRASFYAQGKLVRAGVTRTDLALDLGVCWCGRGALRGYPRPGEAFCCAAHETLWGGWSDQLRARVIVCRFLAIMAGRNVR